MSGRFIESPKRKAAALDWERRREAVVREIGSFPSEEHHAASVERDGITWDCQMLHFIIGIAIIIGICGMLADPDTRNAVLYLLKWLFRGIAAICLSVLFFWLVFAAR